MNNESIRVGIIGCGKIADQHAMAIGRIENCQIVGVCDREPRMAQQLADRFELPWYPDIEALLKAEPNTVHITTPPQSHFDLARRCLMAGMNVYVEKPFTITAEECSQLISLSEQRNLRITAGHNLQFTPEMLEMRALVAKDFLGGRPSHVESHFTYSLDDTSYVGPVLSSRDHWVRHLPGQLFHNIVSHGIAKLTEFLGDDIVELWAAAHQSDRLKRMGGAEICDELRVHLRDIHGTTGLFYFSTQFSPGVNQLRVFGPKASLLVDNSSGSLIRRPNRPAKSYLTYFLPSWREGLEHMRNAGSNAKRFLKRELHQDYGMKALIEAFYQSIRLRDNPPLPYREILLTSKIMDRVFKQIRERPLKLAPI